LLKLKNKEWLAAAGAVSLCLAVLFWVFVHCAIREAAARLEGEARQIRLEVTAVQNYQNAHLDKDKYVKEISDAQQQADKAMPRDFEQASFISRLQREALQAGLTLRQVRPGEPRQAAEGCRTLPVHVQLGGNYFQLLDFLRALGQEERFLQFREMEIKSKDGQLDCGLQLNIFAEPAS